MPIEECAVDIAMSKVPIEDYAVDIAAEEMPPEVTMPEPCAEELTIAEPLCDVDDENATEGFSAACGSLPKEPRASPYTHPPFQLLIGPEEVTYYVPRHFLPDNFVHNGSMTRLSLRSMDIGTGHTFIHYFHTGLYETINTCGDSTMQDAGVKLKHALSVYLASISHDIAGLNALAISEMRTHASRLDLVEVLRAIGEGFQNLGPKSWVHEYLQEKAQAAFEEDGAVFTSQAFLDTLDNSNLAKFMMRCMAECYQGKISYMDRREKEMSEILNDCRNDLRVASQKKLASEQDNAVQHQFIIPLASEPNISECCEIGTFCDDVVSNEDFCTISCPPSEYLNEPRGCPEEITRCSAQPGEHSQNAKTMISYEADSAGPIICEQPLRSIYLDSDASIEVCHGLTGEAAAKDCSNKPQGSHRVLEIQTSKDNGAAQTIIKEKKEKKETKKQRKLRERRERQEMRELWETVNRQRSNSDEGGDKVAGPETHPNYQDEVHKDPVRNADSGDRRMEELEAAVALILQEVASKQSVRSLDEEARQ